MTLIGPRGEERMGEERGDGMTRERGERFVMERCEEEGIRGKGGRRGIQSWLWK